MTTFEMKNTTPEQDEKLRGAGYHIELLDATYANVECKDEDVDVLEERLELMGIEYRLV